jgi:hypothetical protein
MESNLAKPRKASQRSFDGAYARIEFLIGQALLIHADEGKQASIRYEA